MGGRVWSATTRTVSCVTRPTEPLHARSSFGDGQWKAIGYYGNGERCVQSFYPDGQLETIEHYSNGWLHDPADGSPARQWFYPNGSRQAVEHYSNGELFDPADGSPTPRSSSRTWKSRFRKRV